MTTCFPTFQIKFIYRVFLHKDWCGIRDEELSKVSGIENAIFCHATGFIGGNKTKEGCLQMALKSLEAYSNGDKWNKFSYYDYCQRF